MFRLLIIGALIYLFYRLFSRWRLGRSPSSAGSVDHRDAGAIDDIMVKDPQCEVYFPKRKAVQARIDGRNLFFCSTACRDKFLENQPHDENGSTQAKSEREGSES
jgi:YHS domain-containing protein